MTDMEACSAHGRLVLPQDEYEAVRKVAGMLGIGQPAPTLGEGTAGVRLAELENAVTWGTSCLSCSRVLDEAMAERERAEHAEARLADPVIRRALSLALMNAPTDEAADEYRAVLEALDSTEKETSDG